MRNITCHRWERKRHQPSRARCHLPSGSRQIDGRVYEGGSDL